MRLFLAAIAAASLAGASASHADTVMPDFPKGPAGPVVGARVVASGGGVTVALSPYVQERAVDDFGVMEVNDEAERLRKYVADSVARKGLSLRVALVIEDMTPNRPTMEQTRRTVGLSDRSIGVGGARISGSVVEADGAVHRLAYQWYETDLREERGAGYWWDTERAFDTVAHQIASGRLSTRFEGPGPQRRGGHFGYPFSID